MKKLIASFLLLGTLAVAGPLKAAYIAGKTAIYPMHHPKKDIHAGKKVVKATGKVVKTIVW